MFTFFPKRDKIILISILALFSFTRASFAYMQSIQADWNEYRSDHFMINYHPTIPAKYIREFTRKCEQYYLLVAQRLGLRRFDYWSWENRAQILIYASRQDYNRETSRPEWSTASTQIRKKFISTYYFAEDFFDSILPHEITHLVLRELIGFRSRVPLWFEEGTACANEEGCYLKYLLVAKSLLDKKNYIPVERLEQTEKIGNAYNQFYPLAASLVIFLLENYSEDNFIQLCRQLRDGNSFYGAMSEVYEIKDAQELDEKFLAFLNSKSYDDIATQRAFNY